MSRVAVDLQEAFARHQAGDLPQAERLYRDILRDDPAHSEALHLLGVLAHQTGHPAQAVELINCAIHHDPQPRAMIWCNLGAAHQALGDFDSAIENYRRALERDPQYADAQHNLATALAAQGQHSQAVTAYERVLATHPRHRAARLNLGKSLQQLQRYDDAAACYQQLLEEHPADGEAMLNLGAVHALRGHLDAAAECFERLIAQAPDHRIAQFNLGRIRHDQGRLDEAIAHYRRAVAIDPDDADAWNNLGVALKSLKDFTEAESCFQRLVTLRPQSAVAYFNLGNALQAQDRYDDAAASYRRGLHIDPGHIESYLNLGTALTAAGDFTAAEREYRTAIEVRGDSLEAHLNLASSLQNQGRLAEAAAVYERAIRIDPGCEAVQSNALMLPLYRPEFRPEDVYAQHIRWADRLTARTSAPRNFANVRDPDRRLRIGYVSPDLRAHPVGFFMETILNHHDRAAFEVTCYAEHADGDAVTARLRPLVDHWRTTFRRSDADVGAMIRSDKIDILIDLAGHTSGNRLTVFADRPAPLQMTYLGYGTTTGLPTMDYRLTDAIADPPGAEEFHTEQLCRLPAGILCYVAPDDAPDVSPLPAQAGGGITFGSFNNLSKLSEPVLDLWAEVLRTVPQSRLLLKSKSFADSVVRTRYLDQFAQKGIEADRIELRGPTDSIAEHLSLYHRIDLALDPFPYNGATTTCESLWMGVPVITLRGEAFVGRMSASLLTRVGLAEFIADTTDEYLQIAGRWGTSLTQLAELRAELRSMMAASPLCDAAGYVRDLEQAYRGAWRQWCAATT